jgi:hypothetical protein
MTALGDGLELRTTGSRARILPGEGGVASELSVGGMSLLARTPWHDRIRPATEPAPDEQTWVAHWRGGWQLCFPTAGIPDPDARPRQGFHGAASQAPWELLRRGADFAELRWSEPGGLTATRLWRLTGNGLSAETTATNSGPATRGIIVAEHLVLGGDLVAPVLQGEALQLEASKAGLAPLDYAGLPAGAVQPWPGAPADRWEWVDASTPARVACLVDPVQRTVRIVAGRTTVTVRWDGLPHALLWEELARSSEPPWNGQVVALGVEPTSTPHGAGTSHGTDVIRLEPGKSIRWSASLDCLRDRNEERA